MLIVRFQDVAAFTEHLSQQLAQLDDANIHTLMDSESQIQSLMRQLDVGLREIHVGCVWEREGRRVCGASFAHFVFPPPCVCSKWIQSCQCMMNCWHQFELLSISYNRSMHVSCFGIRISAYYWRKCKRS